MQKQSVLFFQWLQFTAFPYEIEIFSLILGKDLGVYFLETRSNMANTNPKTEIYKVAMLSERKLRAADVASSITCHKTKCFLCNH